MNCKNIITGLTIIVIVLSIVTSTFGIFFNNGGEQHQFVSIWGEKITIYGEGIYKNDSVSVAAQGKAQDVITFFIGVPLLLISLLMMRKGSLKGKLLLTGTLGYFMYTYISYTFLSMFNSLFLLYVLLMSASFFAFVLSMLSYDLNKLKQSFNSKLPVKFIGGFQLFFSIAIGVLWLGKILEAMKYNITPAGIDHYTTLVIQGLDLGFIVPVGLISGYMLLKRKALGYLLSSVVIMKGFTMGAALTAMIIGQYLAGVDMSLVEIIMFPLISIIISLCFILLLLNIDEEINVKDKYLKS